jgi:DNA (cytosine-5)-methyltransferase 1
MRGLSLYSGGVDAPTIAAGWCGIETVAFCEADAACRAVLAGHHPGKKIFESDMEVTADGLRASGIDPGGIDIIFGGPPCQCASVAGKRLGAVDPRNRWPEFLRIVCEVRPRWVLAENAPGILSVDAGRLFGEILRELAEAGYRIGWQCWGACDVGAPHRRERVFIVGSLADAQNKRRDGAIANENAARHGGFTNGGDVVNTSGTGREERDVTAVTSEAGYVAGESCRDVGGTERRGFPREPRRRTGKEFADRRDGITEPRLGGDADGIADWMDAAAERLEAQRWPGGKGAEQYDWEPPRAATGIKDRAERLKMIGNSCPSQQYYVAMAAITAMDAQMAKVRITR